LLNWKNRGKVMNGGELPIPFPDVKTPGGGKGARRRVSKVDSDERGGIVTSANRNPSPRREHG
jgi:hypothetical protein